MAFVCLSHARMSLSLPQLVLCHNLLYSHCHVTICFIEPLSCRDLIWFFRIAEPVSNIKQFGLFSLLQYSLVFQIAFSEREFSNRFFLHCCYRSLCSVLSLGTSSSHTSFSANLRFTAVFFFSFLCFRNFTSRPTIANTKPSLTNCLFQSAQRCRRLSHAEDHETTRSTRSRQGPCNCFSATSPDV